MKAKEVAENSIETGVVITAATEAIKAIKNLVTVVKTIIKAAEEGYWG